MIIECIKSNSDNLESKNSSYNNSNGVDYRFSGKVTKSQYGYIKFASREAYDEVLSYIGNFEDKELDDWEQSLGFVSAYTAYKNPQRFKVNIENNLNSLFEDQFLLRIIDVNGMMQIGEHVFNLQSNNCRLLAINHNFIAQFRDVFAEGIYVPSVMNQYNTLIDNFDVFEHLNTGIVGFDNYNTVLSNDKNSALSNFNTLHINNQSVNLSGGIKTLSDENTGNGGIKTHSDGNTGNGGLKSHSDKNTGSGKGAGTPEDPKKVNTLFTNKTAANNDLVHNGVVWRADIKVSYQSVLVYFSLVAEMKYMAGGPIIWTQKKTNIWFYVDLSSPLPIVSTYCKFTPNKRSEDIPSIPYKNIDNKINDNKLNWRPYEGSRILIDYDLNAVFAYANAAGNIDSVQVRVKK